MRLTTERLQEITHCKRKSAQSAWFRLHLGADVPCDRTGPILTEASYEKLLEKRLGLAPSSSANNTVRPTVRLIDRKAA